MADETQDDIRVNGNLVSWGSWIFKIDGVRWYGVTGFEWDDARERAYGYGMDGAHGPIGRTKGKQTPGNVKITFHKHAAIRLNNYLASKSADGASIGDVETFMTLQCDEGDIQGDVVFEQAVLVKRPGKAEENPDPQMVDREFQVMNIIEDGTTLRAPVNA